MMQRTVFDIHTGEVFRVSQAHAMAEIFDILGRCTPVLDPQPVEKAHHLIEHLLLETVRDCSREAAGMLGGMIAARLAAGDLIDFKPGRNGLARGLMDIARAAKAYRLALESPCRSDLDIQATDAWRSLVAALDEAEAPL